MSEPAAPPSSAPRRVSGRVKRPSLVKEEAEAEEELKAPAPVPTPVVAEAPPEPREPVEPPKITPAKRKYTKRAKPNPPLDTPTEKTPRNARDKPEEVVIPPLGLSDTLQEYLASSRLRWLNGAVFPLYWTRPSAAARKKDGLALPKELNMTSHPVGSCTMVVEPHVFEVRFYGVKLPPAPGPSVAKPKATPKYTAPIVSPGASATQMPVSIQFRPPYMGPPGSVTSTPGQTALAQKPLVMQSPQVSGVGTRPPNVIDSLGTTTPKTQTALNPATPQVTTTIAPSPSTVETPIIKTEPSSKPLIPPQSANTPVTPAPLQTQAQSPPKAAQALASSSAQPVPKAADAKALTVQALAERARTDKKFQALMELVAKNTATKEERASFQKQMHEIVAAAEKMAKEVVAPAYVPVSQSSPQARPAVVVQPALNAQSQAIAPPQAAAQPLHVIDHAQILQPIPQTTGQTQHSQPVQPQPLQPTRATDPNAMDLDPPTTTPVSTLPQPPARKKPGPKPKPKPLPSTDSPNQHPTPQPRAYTPKLKPPVPDPPIPRNPSAMFQDLLLEFIPQGPRYLFPRMALLENVAPLTFKLTFYHIYTVKARKKFQPIAVYLTSTNMKIFDIMRSIVGPREMVLSWMAETRREIERAEETIPSVRKALEKVMDQVKEEDKEEEKVSTQFPAPISLCV